MALPVAPGSRAETTRRLSPRARTTSRIMSAIISSRGPASSDMELRRAQDAHRHRRLLKDLLLAELALVVAVRHPVQPDDRGRDDVPHARRGGRAHQRPRRCLEELAAAPLPRRRGVGRVDHRVDARERGVKAGPCHQVSAGRTGDHDRLVTIGAQRLDRPASGDARSACHRDFHLSTSTATIYD
jgi:hypothetical protein